MNTDPRWTAQSASLLNELESKRRREAESAGGDERQVEPGCPATPTGAIALGLAGLASRVIRRLRSRGA